MLLVSIFTLKPVVLDPQGDTVLAALHQLDFSVVTSVRVGKYLEISLQAENVEDASSLVRRMCDQLLANPVIERYDFTVEARRVRTGSETLVEGQPAR